MSCLLCAKDPEGTGLTFDDVADAFTGDLLAAANAFLALRPHADPLNRHAGTGRPQAPRPRVVR